MRINPRRQRRFKKRLVFILFLGILGASGFLLNIVLNSGKPLFISPIGKMDTDLSRVEKILKENKILFSQVAISDYSCLVNILNNGQVTLSRKKDIGKQIASLQRILNQITIEGKLFRSIDFRFDEPIISF